MLSVPHMIVVFIVVLVVFGPQKLPELARTFGKLMAEFRKASGDFKNAFEEEMRDLERQTRLAELKRQAAEAVTVNSPATLASPAGGATALPETISADTRATEAPVITPVAESVPRLDAQPGESTADSATHEANASETLSSETPDETIGQVDPASGVAHRPTSGTGTSNSAQSGSSQHNSAEPDPNPSHDQQPA
jgi:TatA/E family protein of Tat protein translocase